jgi:hypothetical protein
MKRVLAPVIVAACVMSLIATAVPTARADAGTPPPYIDYVRWVSYSGLPTLRVYPTTAGREVAGELGKTAVQTDEAWAEVVALAPDADSPGIRSQFLCHWRFAEFAAPGKTSWDLESWRPVVDDNTMILAGCNPGGAEKG